MANGAHSLLSRPLGKTRGTTQVGHWPFLPPLLRREGDLHAPRVVKRAAPRNCPLADLRVIPTGNALVRICPTQASKAASAFIHYNRITLTEEILSTGSVRDRLLVALADPEIAAKARRNPATLVAFHEPMAVFEWVGTGKGLVLLDHDKIPAGELRVHVDRVLGAHERGLLFVAVAGGAEDVGAVLKAADAEARNRDHLGLYHVDDAGKLLRVAGRRLPELEAAARELPRSKPLSPEDIARIVEHGRKERQDAVTFVQGTSRHFPHLTVAMIALCVLLYALTAGNDLRAHKLALLLCNDPVAVREGQLWRLLTYALLHDTRGPTHLIVNMLSLYSLGTFLEPLLGRRRLGILCATTALAGGVASTLFTASPSVGASGMVWGLMGAIFGLLRSREPLFPALIARGLRQRLVVVLAINIAISFLPGIDRYCHFGGGLAGYLVARLYARHPVRRAS